MCSQSKQHENMLGRCRACSAQYRYIRTGRHHCIGGRRFAQVAFGCLNALGWRKAFCGSLGLSGPLLAQRVLASGCHVGQRPKRVALHGHPLVTEVLSKFRPPPPDVDGKVVLLDVGSGDGEITHRLLELPGVSTVIGVDSDAEVVKEAKASALALRGGKAGTVDFVQGSATDVDFFRQLTGGLRYLTCFTTLHWLKQPAHAQELALVNFARALDPGGQMFIVHFLGLDDSFMQLEADIAHQFLGDGHVAERVYTPMFAGLPAKRRLAQFHGLFKAVGLTAEEVRIADDRFPIAKDQFLQFLQGASAHINDVPQSKRRDYLEQWRAEMLAQKKITSNGNSYEFVTKALLAVLRKRDAAPDAFYDHLVGKCEDGVLRLEHLEYFGQAERPP